MGIAFPQIITPISILCEKRNIKSPPAIIRGNTVLHFPSYISNPTTNVIHLTNIHILIKVSLLSYILLGFEFYANCYFDNIF